MAKKNPMVSIAIKYMSKDGSDLPCAIRDMITDIMDLCDKKGIDFDSRVANAREVQLEEALLEG